MCVFCGSNLVQIWCKFQAINSKGFFGHVVQIYTKFHIENHKKFKIIWDR